MSVLAFDKAASNELVRQPSIRTAESCRGLQHRHGLPRATACQLGRHDTEQLVYTIASDWRDDAKLRKMCTDRIDHRSLLTDE